MPVSSAAISNDWEANPVSLTATHRMYLRKPIGHQLWNKGKKIGLERMKYELVEL
jgi:hypothetical protein